MTSSYAKYGTLVMITQRQKEQLDRLKKKSEPYHAVIDRLLDNYIEKRV